MPPTWIKHLMLERGSPPDDGHGDPKTESEEARRAREAMRAQAQRERDRLRASTSVAPPHR